MVDMRRPNCISIADGFVCEAGGFFRMMLLGGLRRRNTHRDGRVASAGFSKCSRLRKHNRSESPTANMPIARNRAVCIPMSGARTGRAAIYLHGPNEFLTTNALTPSGATRPIPRITGHSIQERHHRVYRNPFRWKNK